MERYVIEMKKIILFLLLLLVVQPALASAYVSLSTSGTTVPTTVEPGSNVNLILTIANLGTTTAENVKLNLNPGTYISPEQYQYSLQVIQAGSSTQVTIPLKISNSIPEGTNALFFSIDYSEGGTSGTRTLENSVTISVTKRSLTEVSNVSYSKDFIQPGDTVLMKVELQNLGKGTIKDLVVSLKNISSLFVPIGSDTDVYLGTLQSLQKNTASFNLIVNKNVNTLAYSIPVTLAYYDEANVLHTDQKYVGIKISGKPEFVVSVEKQENMYAGNVGKLSISISNRGTATAQFLTLKFDSLVYVTPNEYYAGNLDPDDSSTISLDVNLIGMQTGKHSLNMTMFYKDPYNKDYSETRILQFDVTNMPVQISTNMQIIIGLVVVAIVYWKRNSIKRLVKRK
jgi:hypothetical protein